MELYAMTTIYPEKDKIIRNRRKNAKERLTKGDIDKYSYLDFPGRC